MQYEIKRSTGRNMREPTTKMLLLTPDAIPLARADREAIERAEDDGLHPRCGLSESLKPPSITKDG